MTDVAVDRLRLRGPGAQRLARVAATTLPAALDGALADVGNVVLEQVVVALDLAVDDYDDETLALLWADAIRARVVAGAADGLRAANRVDGTRAASGVDGVAKAAPRPPLAPPDVVAAARRWMSATTGHGDELPAALMALADPQVAASAREQLSAPEWQRLLASLASLIGPPDPPRAAGTRTPGDGAALGTVAVSDCEPSALPPDRGVSQMPDQTSGRALDQMPGWTPDHALAQISDQMPDLQSRLVPDHEPYQVTQAEVLADLAAIAQVAPDGTGAIILASLTRAAGLVLLYPWLSDHCRRAEALHPRLDVMDVREAALAAVVEPDDPTLVDDPLVRLLAGRSVSEPAERRTRMQLRSHREVAESAVGVLTGFAALLPGFERSSPAFVRESWVVRRGLLETDLEPARLTTVTHPLDVVLPRLPYPVGLLKLPWSTLVSARFR